ncbi:MAG: hypothetical protein R3A51_20685 [Nannocystaceae bacterium]
MVHGDGRATLFTLYEASSSSGAPALDTRRCTIDADEVMSMLARCDEGSEDCSRCQMLIAISGLRFADDCVALAEPVCAL